MEEKIAVEIGNKNQDALLMQCYICGATDKLCLHALRRLDKGKISGWIVHCDKCSNHFPMTDFILESQLKQSQKE